jgi:hypothetical protein
VTSKGFVCLERHVEREYREKGRTLADARRPPFGRQRGRAVAGKVSHEKQAAARPKGRPSAPTRRAPSRSTAKPAGTRRNADDLATARRASRTFHGAGAGDVIKLTRAGRTLPEYVVPLGRMPELDYKPERGQRAAWKWRHESGDRGAGKAKSRRQPVLAADPTTGRPIIVGQGSPMRFNRRKGLVG